ncbi:MAG: Ldh family oxidoreductase [Desulfobacterales bacterium]
MSETYYFTREQLEKTIHDICKAGGSPDDEADLVARRLVKSNLTGHPSHGVIRIPMYIGMAQHGMMKAGAIPEIEIDNGPTVLINGNDGYGQVVAQKTIEVAIERALAHGIAAVGMTNNGHIGRLADYSVQAADAGCIGIVFTTTGGSSFLVAPFGGKSARMGTNPISIALPSDRKFPVVMDMATSVYAEGKFPVMIDSGKSAPEKSLLDKDGQPTTNPSDLYEGGTILPLGGVQGYKGYLLNFMVEAVAAVLTGSGFMGRDEKPKFNNCTLMILIQVEKFRELSGFKLDLETLIGFMKASPSHEGDEVLYPGEVEERTETEMLKTGIPLADKTVEKIQETIDRLEVPLKLAELGQTTPLS